MFEYWIGKGDHSLASGWNRGVTTYSSFTSRARTTSFTSVSRLASRTSFTTSSASILDNSSKTSLATGTSDAGFTRQLKTYEAMPPKRAQAILVDLPEDVAARYLAAMKTQTRANVIDRFRSPADLAKLQRLLKLMRDL